MRPSLNLYPSPFKIISSGGGHVGWGYYKESASLTDMNIIIVDLPWNLNTKGRIALAIADPDRNVTVARADDIQELLNLIKNNAEQRSFVLLDIPVEGCDSLNGEKFRPVSKSLSRQGIWMQPDSKAKGSGKVLKELILQTCAEKEITIREIYPYAVYKFLAYVEKNGILSRLEQDRFEALLDEGFRGFKPPKYKREKNREQRLKNMEYLYSLLTDSRLGFKYNSLRSPEKFYSLGELDRLCDGYDACLGAIVGIYYIGKSRYSFIAGGPGGNILILADKWLAERLRKWTAV